MSMVALSVWRVGSIPGEHAAINLKPSAANPFHKYLVRDRIDRLWNSPDHSHFRSHAFLQPGGRAPRGVGRRGDGGDADLRRVLRSVDRGVVGSHAIAMGPAPSVHVRL